MPISSSSLSVTNHYVDALVWQAWLQRAELPGSNLPLPVRWTSIWCVWCKWSDRMCLPPRMFDLLLLNPNVKCIWSPLQMHRRQHNPCNSNSYAFFILTSAHFYAIQTESHNVSKSSVWYPNLHVWSLPLIFPRILQTQIRGYLVYTVPRAVVRAQ